MGESVIYNDLVVEGKVKANNTDEGKAASKIVTIDKDGKLAHRTAAEVISDLGIDEKQPKGNYQPAGDYALKSDLPDISGKLDKAGGTLTGPVTLATGDGLGILIPPNGTINDTKGGTLFGLLGGNFQVGYGSYPTMLRGQGIYTQTPIHINSGDGQGLLIPLDGNMNVEGTSNTVLGFLNGVFTIGNGAYGLNIRGSGDRPQYNSADLALKSDVPDVSGLQPKGNYLEISAEDYVENAHVWFRNSIWANSISCNNLSGVQNFTAAWLKSSSVSDLNAVPSIYPVFRDDKWIYSRTRDEMKSDLGINDKLDKATFSTRAPTASDGKSGDFWIQV